MYMGQQRWNISNQRLLDLANQYNVSEIARITGFSNPTVDRYLAKAGIKAQPYQSQWASLTEQYVKWSCKKHGTTTFRRTLKHGKLDCYKCLKCERATSRRRRINARQRLIQQEGDSCVDCGYDDWRVLQFHHRDPSTKEFGVGSYTGLKSDQTLALEIDKCDLLCANCHVLRHFEMNAV